MEITFCFALFESYQAEMQIGIITFFCGLPLNTLFGTCPKSTKLVTGNEFAPAVKPESA